MGYSNAGVVIDSDSDEFSVGDRVVSNGCHAEIVNVPYNLCARIPDEVTLEDASFTVVGSIGLQGIRLLNPNLGENIVVIGLGLIGLLCVQMLIANGCQVLGIDYDSHRCELARKFGAQTVDLSNGGDAVEAGMKFSSGNGVDGVLITASTKSHDPVRQAANMCRKRGRIILVGVVGLNLSRGDFYEKEISFQVSCSYGPGRYDRQYEEKGCDYPIGFVRWTEQRNFNAFLKLLADSKIDVKPLISHRFEFEKALDGYLEVQNREALGIILNYSQQVISKAENRFSLIRSLQLPLPSKVNQSEVIVGVIGAGNYAGQVLLPALKATEARMKIIVSAGGINGTHHGRKLGFEVSSTIIESIIEDDEINLVLISTRHNLHASLVKKILESGKNVFVEKPLCISKKELVELENYISKENPKGFLMVGFNRRFAPHIVKMKELLSVVVEPKALVMNVNAGHIPSHHWTQDPEIGGGRIIGESCHFIDLLRFLVGEKIVKVSSCSLDSKCNAPRDTVTIQITFSDGSIGTVHYFSNGNKKYPKERLEVFTSGRVLVMDNYRQLLGYGWKNFSNMKLWKQNKGHMEEISAVIEAVKSGLDAPIPLDEIIEVTRASFKA